MQKATYRKGIQNTSKGEMYKMKNIKRLPLFLPLFILIFALSGCGEIENQDIQTNSDMPNVGVEAEAEAKVTGMLEAFKTLDFDEAGKYIDLSEIQDAENAASNNISTDLVMNLIFKNFDYAIASSEKIDENAVSVKASITATDMKTVFNDYLVSTMQYAFSAALSGEQPSEEEIQAKAEELFVEFANKDNLATVTNDVDIAVVKDENGQFQIQADDALVDALFGGLVSAAEELNSSLVEREK